MNRTFRAIQLSPPACCNSSICRCSLRAARLFSIAIATETATKNAARFRVGFIGPSQPLKRCAVQSYGFLKLTVLAAAGLRHGFSLPPIQGSLRRESFLTADGHTGDRIWPVLGRVSEISSSASRAGIA